MNKTLSAKTRIAIVENHSLVRKSLTNFINDHSASFEVTIECSDGRELMNEIKRSKQSDLPEIVLSDLNMPVMDGYETTRWLKNTFPAIKVIILSMRNDEVSMIRLIKAGISGYLIKNIEADDLLNALSSVAAGGTYFKAPALDIEGADLDINPVVEAWYSLNERERQYVRYCAADLEDREIFEKMGLRRSEDAFGRKILAKFAVKTRVGLVLLMVKNRLIDTLEYRLNRTA